jgi:hypothetical protein
MVEARRQVLRAREPQAARAMCERSHTPNQPSTKTHQAMTRYPAAETAKGRRRSCFEELRRPFTVRSVRRPPGRPPHCEREAYLTVTVLVAEVLDALECTTRTRTLYLPFAVGAFHLRL